MPEHPENERLSDLLARQHVVRVQSRLLGELVVWVADSAGIPDRTNEVVYRETELRGMEGLSPTDVRTINYNRSAYLPPMTSFALMRSIRTNSYLVSWIDRIAERNRGGPVTDQPGDGRHPMARSFYDLRTASECGSETLLDHADAYIRWRISPGKTRHYRDATSAFLHAQATAMVMADMQTELGDVPLHVLIIPERMQVKDDEWYWLTTHFPDLFVDRRGTVDRLERALADRGVASTSLIESLDESSYLRFDGHFSTQGHLRVAQHVARMLKQRHGDLLSGARTRRKP